MKKNLSQFVLIIILSYIFSSCHSKISNDKLAGSWHIDTIIAGTKYIDSIREHNGFRPEFMKQVEATANQSTPQSFWDIESAFYFISEYVNPNSQLNYYIKGNSNILPFEFHNDSSYIFQLICNSCVSNKNRIISGGNYKLEKDSIYFDKKESDLDDRYRYLLGSWKIRNLNDKTLTFEKTISDEKYLIIFSRVVEINSNENNNSPKHSIKKNGDTFIGHYTNTRKMELDIKKFGDDYIIDDISEPGLVRAHDSFNAEFKNGALIEIGMAHRSITMSDNNTISYDGDIYYRQ